MKSSSYSSRVPPQQNHHPHHYQRQQNHHRQHPPSLHNHHHHHHHPPPPPPVYDQTLIYYGFQQPTPSGFRGSISPLLPQYYYYFYYDYLNDLYYNSQPVNSLLPWTHQRERIASSSSSSSSVGGGDRRRRDWVQESRASVNIPMQISYVPLDETAVFDLFPEDFVGLDVNSDDCNLLSEENVLKHLKTRKYQTPAGAGKEVEEICVVCQSEYEDEEELGILGCRHEYHASCITRWLMTKNVCPVCKRAAIDQES
ncbi:hypothetical protein ACH5RR_028652 [Cinchona calisaya]|uniref:RING-type E3 ubiquitin transferase n=1 Tax=Cinchona calisaya TaxID=153742 RepID=A0ABD2YQT4_9GENT